jgi:hypothetical protein
MLDLRKVNEPAIEEGGNAARPLAHKWGIA